MTDQIAPGAEVHDTGATASSVHVAPAAPGAPTSPGPDEKKVQESMDKMRSWPRKIWHAFLAFFSSCAAVPDACTRKTDEACDWLEATFPPEMYIALSRWFGKLGHVSLVFAAMVTVVYSLAAAVRSQTFGLIIVGAGAILLLAVVQYASDKFLSAVDGLIKATPSVMKSHSFLRCMAVICEAAVVIIFVGSILAAIEAKSMNPFWVGLGFSILFDAISFIALHPSLTNTLIAQDASSGEEAIGIASFFIKILMRLLPVIFGTGAAIGTVSLAINTIALIANEGNPMVGSEAIGIVLAVGLLPMACYIIFAAFCLGVELLRAILNLKKIEK